MSNEADKTLDNATLQVRAARAASTRLAVKTFFDEPTFTATHVAWDPKTKRAAIIDSVLNFDFDSGRTSTKGADAVIEFVKSEGLGVDWLLETHAHADHLSAAPYLQEKLGGKLAIGSEIVTVQNVFGKIFNFGEEFRRDGSQFDKLFKDGDTFTVGDIPAIALYVPGHTPADLAYVIGDAAFIGDTLFMPDYGTARADFPGGDAHKLYRSIRRLLSLPGETRVFLCHDYKAPQRAVYVWETTIADQKEKNVHVHDGVSEEEFVEMRTKRDATLDLPHLIIPSVQVNVRGGHLPPAESNGKRYLKVPLDVL
ncbi:MAG: MBL fold metallo-hydrolase [Methylocystis sp.]|nr:MBL fold metallo-hydrolase [Methylocystis sp.]